MDSFIFILRILTADGHIKQEKEISVPVDDPGYANMIAIKKGLVDENDDNYTIVRKTDARPTGGR